MNMSGCVFVYRCVREHISETEHPIFAKFLCTVLHITYMRYVFPVVGCGISQCTIANSDETTHFVQSEHVTVTFDLVNSSAKQMIKF